MEMGYVGAKKRAIIRMLLIKPIILKQFLRFLGVSSAQINVEIQNTNIQNC